MQLLRLMSVLQEGILLSTGNMYTSTSDTINKVSFVNRLWDLKLIYIHTNRYNSAITPKWAKNETFHIHVKSEHGYSPKYPEHVFSVIGLSLCRHGHYHKLRQITKCDGKDS